MKLSHLDEAGRARMVDVGDKPVTERTAEAEGAVRMSREAFEAIVASAVEKGDVLTVAQVARTMASQTRANVSARKWYRQRIHLMCMGGRSAKPRILGTISKPG